MKCPKCGKTMGPFEAGFLSRQEDFSTIWLGMHACVECNIYVIARGSEVPKELDPASFLEGFRLAFNHSDLVLQVGKARGRG